MNRPFLAAEASLHCQIEPFSIDTLIDMPAHAGVRVSFVVKRKAGAA